MKAQPFRLRGARIRLRLSRIMQQRGITESTLAKLAQTQQPTVNAWKNGSSQPLVLNAIRVARALGTTVEDIWGCAVELKP